VRKSSSPAVTKSGGLALERWTRDTGPRRTRATILRNLNETDENHRFGLDPERDGPDGASLPEGLGGGSRRRRTRGRRWPLTFPPESISAPGLLSTRGDRRDSATERLNRPRAAPPGLHVGVVGRGGPRGGHGGGGGSQRGKIRLVGVEWLPRSRAHCQERFECRTAGHAGSPGR